MSRIPVPSSGLQRHYSTPDSPSSSAHRPASPNPQASAMSFNSSPAADTRRKQSKRDEVSTVSNEASSPSSLHLLSLPQPFHPPDPSITQRHVNLAAALAGGVACGWEALPAFSYCLSTCPSVTWARKNIPLPHSFVCIPPRRPPLGTSSPSLHPAHPLSLCSHVPRSDLLFRFDRPSISSAHSANVDFRLVPKHRHTPTPYYDSNPAGNTTCLYSIRLSQRCSCSSNRPTLVDYICQPDSNYHQIRI